MPEISQIEAYQKIVDKNYKPALNHFAKFLERIGVSASEIKDILGSFEWQEKGKIGYVSGTTISHTSVFPDKSGLAINTYLNVESICKDKYFGEYWASVQILFSTADVMVDEKYTKEAIPTIKRLVKLLFESFSENGVFFTNEGQDGEVLNGILGDEPDSIWQFEYALAPQSIGYLFKNKPVEYNAEQNTETLEFWNSYRWNID